LWKYRLGCAAALCGVVAATGVEAHYFFIVQPPEADREIGAVFYPERIVIQNFTPGIQPNSGAIFNSSNLLCVVKARRYPADYKILLWPHCTSARLGMKIGQREGEVRWQREGLYIGGHPMPDVIGRRMSGVNEHHARLEPYPDGIVLRNDISEPSGNVSPQLKRTDMRLALLHFTQQLMIIAREPSGFSERSSDALHSDGGATSFGDRLRHIVLLPVSNSPGQIDGLAQSPRLDAKNDRLPDQGQKLQNADNGKRGGETNHPPIGRRLVASILCLLGAFCCCLFGGKYLYNNRLILSATWFSVSVLLGVCAFSLIGLLALRSIWGWWL